MNLFLNSIPQYPELNLGAMNLGSPYNPYLTLPYQSMMFSQLNQLSQNFSNPYYPGGMNMVNNDRKAIKPVTFIIIDEE